MGIAWADYATGVDEAHNPVECSNMGNCDRASGTCVCNPGYEGHACNRLTCPNLCNGHGTCRSMKYHASKKDPGSGAVWAYTDNWDAELVQGCHCDSGYSGFDCSLRDCPVGDDPLTGIVSDENGLQFNEKQSIECKATSGYFTVTFKGATTEHIAFDDRSFVVESKLNALPTINRVAVSFTTTATVKACNSLGNTITVEFTQDFGDQPLLLVDATNLEHWAGDSDLILSVEEEDVGTKESIPCSGRGLCDVASGFCGCFIGYVTGNGYGAAGTRGDCSFPESSITSCPGEVACSGHGVCLGPNTYRCQCSNGWQGGDCSERSCPSGKAWFSEAVEEDDKAHSRIECSNMGTCDRTKGECICFPGFEGGSCQLMTCPGAGCSGHGSCISISMLAELADINGDAATYTYGEVPNKKSTWDFESVRGCHCDSGWEGYDCTLRSCPKGDDIYTTSQQKEKQLIRCTASSGQFSVSFRQAETTSLSYAVDRATLKTALELLPTIGNVEVNFDKYDHTDDSADTADNIACTADGTNLITVVFTTELGDVPALKFVEDGVDSIDIFTDGTTATDYEGNPKDSYPGTFENEVCGRRGVCDFTTGQCKCYTGFGSSDGSGGPGTRGDCGYQEPIYGGSASAAANE